MIATLLSLAAGALVLMAQSAAAPDLNKTIQLYRTSQNKLGEWTDCLVDNTARFSKSSERASDVVAAAFGECTAQEKAAIDAIEASYIDEQHPERNRAARAEAERTIANMRPRTTEGLIGMVIKRRILSR